MRLPPRILEIVGAAVAVVLVAVALQRTLRFPVRRVPPPATAKAPRGEPGDDVIARALRLASTDSTHKDQWVDEIPDLDLPALSPAARATFLRIANGRRCTCGCGYTLAGCRRFDAQCEYSGPRARALYDSVRAGAIARADGYPERPQF